MWTQVNGQWPESTLELSFKIIIVSIFIFILTNNINGQLESWSRPSLELTLKSSFKTITIIFYIIILTRVNDDLSLDRSPGLIHKLSFKIMIIKFFIFMLIQVNDQLDPSLNWVSRLIIIIFILTIDPSQ
jgi:hypothetical protein